MMERPPQRLLSISSEPVIPRLKALGGLVVLDEEGRVSGSIRGRNLALLALLARTGEAGMSRDKLAALLWPESDQARARHSLDQALYTVRQALGSDVFVSAAGALALNQGAIETDVEELRRAVRAIGAASTTSSRYEVDRPWP